MFTNYRQFEQCCILISDASYTITEPQNILCPVNSITSYHHINISIIEVYSQASLLDCIHNLNCYGMSTGYILSSYHGNRNSLCSIP